MHDYVKNGFTNENDGVKHSLIPLQNEELGRRSLIIDSQVELKDSKKVRDQCRKKTYGMLRMGVKK